MVLVYEFPTHLLIELLELVLVVESTIVLDDPIDVGVGYLCLVFLFESVVELDEVTEGSDVLDLDYLLAVLELGVGLLL